MDRDDAQELPLMEAIRRWCDPQLLAAFDVACAEADRLAALPRLPSRLEVPGMPARVTRAHNERSRALRRAQAARSATWELVLRDFRQRLRRGELLAQGVQTRPARRQAVATIPGIWASDFAFELRKCAIRCDTYRYIDVRVVPAATPGGLAAPDRGAGPEGARAPSPGLEAGDPTDAAGDEDPMRPRRRRGREPYEALITEALRARLDERAVRGASHPEPPLVWAHEARVLLKRLRIMHPDRHSSGHLPSEETIRTRLPRIYRRVASEKPVR